MMRYFVTGTDTGIGKTVIATLLARGLGAKYWKPIQTGPEIDSDRHFAARWIGEERIISETYNFKLAASPHFAAAAENSRISLDAITNPTDDPLIIEGAGGVLVPLNESDLMIDLIAKLGASVILVSATKLGTINHTLLAIEALRVREIPIAGVILNGDLDQADALADTFQKFGKVRILGKIPFAAAIGGRWLDANYQNLKGLS